MKIDVNMYKPTIYILCDRDKYLNEIRYNAKLILLRMSLSSKWGVETKLTYYNSHIFLVLSI